MHIFFQIVFWLSLIFLLYSYAGYALFVWIYLKIFKPNPKPVLREGKDLLPVTLIVAAYNEASILDKKIQNCLELDYPLVKLKLIFIADGSNDDSTSVISRYPRIQLLHRPERAGKVAAINRAMEFVETDYVIFCDANTSLNKMSIREIMKHYQDPLTGAVAGEKKVEDESGQTGASGAGEGLYWKYESFLKKLDSDFYSVVGAAGELFSIRTFLYEPVEENVLLDDFIISMRICRRGYRVRYEPAAFASEPPSFTMKEEQKRKIRISAGGFQSVKMLADLLNIFRYGKLSFLYISHRVLRWVLCPVMLPFIFLSNVFILFYNSGTFYTIMFIAQFLFYAAATIGWIFASKNIRIKSLYVPYYFVFMNAAMFIGFKKFIQNNQSVLWEKARRKVG